VTKRFPPVEALPGNGDHAVDLAPDNELRMAVSQVGSAEPIRVRLRRVAVQAWDLASWLRSRGEFPFGRTNRFLDEARETTLPLRYICEHQPNRGINAFPT
jgi:hypothetical protein